jgi:hypothetical protein
MTGFKIHCILLTKNEEDVILDCINEALKWADYIYVYDGMSTDTTWEKVCNINDPKVIPWKQDGKTFKEGLRAEVFNAFRSNSLEGDWWLQLNADEFYPSSPRIFFEKIPKHTSFVWGNFIDYVLTEKEVENIDFSQPFEKNRHLFKHYYSVWSEPRAFRYRNRLVWDENCAWPYHAGLVAKEKISFKHYPCRSPEQLKKRWITCIENKKNGFEGWPDEVEKWRQEIKKSAEYLFDDGVWPLVLDESKYRKHMETRCLRLIKYVMHGMKIFP